MTESERSAEHPSEAIPPMPRPGRVKWLKAAATLGAACAGLVGAMGLYATGSAAEKTTPPERVDLVEATRIEAARAQARVEATGTVIADQQVVLSPEVAGRLTWVADGLKPGQRFSKGSTIARIDSRDHEAGVAAERSRLHQPELELSLERTAARWRPGVGPRRGRIRRRQPCPARAPPGGRPSQCGGRPGERTRN